MSSTYLDTEKDAQTNQESVRSSLTGHEKKTPDNISTGDDTAIDSSAAPAKVEEASSDEKEYPHGIQLIGIVVSLLLSIALVALDQVRIVTPPHYHLSTSAYLKNYRRS